MAAPMGNKFWLARSKHGRNPKFETPEKLEEACIEYFEWVEANPLMESKPFAYEGAITMAKIPRMRAMTLAGLCLFLDITRITWGEYSERKDFTSVTTRVEEIIRTQKFAGAAAGFLKENIIARDLGLADKQELTGKDGGPLKHDLINADDARSAFAAALAKAGVTGPTEGGAR